jgi:hypothetical protein
VSIFRKFPSVRHAVSLLAFAVLAACLHARAEQAKNEDMSCDGSPVTEHRYDRQSNDVVQARHIELTRPFSGAGTLEISVCNAQLQVRSATTKELKLTVEAGSLSSGQQAADSVHIFRVAPDAGVIHLKFSHDSHATVTLLVPMREGSKNEFNVGKGELDFDAIGGAGKREINVGAGHMNLLLDGDKNYSNMEVNIGLGSLHDHRPGGHDGHIIVSKNYSGTGTGSLEINVGAGSLDIRQE